MLEGAILVPLADCIFFMRKLKNVLLTNPVGYDETSQYNINVHCP